MHWRLLYFVISLRWSNIIAALLSLSSSNAAMCCLMWLALLSYCIRHFLAIYMARNDSLSLYASHCSTPSSQSCQFSFVCPSSITHHTSSITLHPSLITHIPQSIRREAADIDIEQIQPHVPSGTEITQYEWVWSHTHSNPLYCIPSHPIPLLPFKSNTVWSSSCDVKWCGVELCADLCLLVWRDVMLCDVVWRDVVLCSVVRYFTVWCGVVCFFECLSLRMQIKILSAICPL